MAQTKITSIQETKSNINKTHIYSLTNSFNLVDIFTQKIVSLQFVERPDNHVVKRFDREKNNA